ncbi:type VI secretion system baseplate subunit TssE [Sphingomonas sp.]|uniref:type VI secretion system baseplate subunit TssE n=1 Tax=Sphingomonas sp. TaxID=28214 RepID=UPI0028AE290A|nr:type VI secretion system baseplate subunit TssE [Sphingomonas sp.]
MAAPRPLLFDRLKQVPRHAHARGPAFLHASVTRDQLEASVLEQLDWLLNTRAPWRADLLESRTRDGLRSTIDYGLPDLSLYPLGNAEAMARLERHLAEIIAAYEPRITAAMVTFEAAERRDTLIVIVSGILHFDGIAHPLRLRIPIAREQAGGNAR